MHTGLTAPADVFHELPAAQALACGITAHLVDPSHLRPARAWRHDRHDRIDAARYTGWYADCYQYEILTGYVYAFEADTDDLDDDDEAPTTYYAIVESDDTDLHYLSPDAYDEPLEAALAADRMAELQRECDAIRNQAAHAREQLAEGNRLRRRSLRDTAPRAGLPDRRGRPRARVHPALPRSPRRPTTRVGPHRGAPPAPLRLRSGLRASPDTGRMPRGRLARRLGVRGPAVGPSRTLHDA